jgi:hypothetical protein
MNPKKTLRIAVLGTPQTEQWLLVRAFAATQERQCAYELVTDPSAARPDMFVVDAEHDHAIARWMALDGKGAVPAAFFGRVHPRAKSAVVVSRPHTSGTVVDALDQLERRFLAESSVTSVRASRAASREPELAHAAA